MALKSTIHKAQIALADIDHGVYTDLALTIARHPSETPQRLMVRLAALALNAHAVQTTCGGDARIEFGAGLSDPDDPDVHITDYTGRKRLWIEVGQPEDKPLARACSRADAVTVYAYGPAAEVWWKGIANRVSRLERLTAWRFPSEAAAELESLCDRSMVLQATVQDGVLTLGSGAGVVSLEPQRWQ
jgi:uncharacterized protein YaeQ